MQIDQLLGIGPDGTRVVKVFSKLAQMILLFVLVHAPAFAQERDVEGSSDYPLLSRMEHFYISGYEVYAYESHEFYDAQDNEYVVEGRKWVIDYTLKTGFQAPGQLKVRKNYIDAIRRLGGTILFDRGLYGRAARVNKEIWIEVWVSDHGTDYTLTIVEKGAAREAIAANAGVAVKTVESTVVRSAAGQATEGEELENTRNIKQMERALAVTKENRDEVLVLLSEVSQKVSSGLSMACPDVSSTPKSPPSIPMPYPNTGRASKTAKGSKKVSIAADKATALMNESNFRKTEGDEVGQKTRSLVDLIQRQYEKGAIREVDRISWRSQLLSYQDQSAAIAQAVERYVEEIERLLAESKKEAGIR